MTTNKKPIKKKFPTQSLEDKAIELYQKEQKKIEDREKARQASIAVFEKDEINYILEIFPEAEHLGKAENGRSLFALCGYMFITSATGKNLIPYKDNKNLVDVWVYNLASLGEFLVAQKTLEAMTAVEKQYRKDWFKKTWFYRIWKLIYIDTAPEKESQD